MAGRTPTDARRGRVIVSAIELIGEAQLADFLTFLTAPRIAAASVQLAAITALDLSPTDERERLQHRPVSEATVRDYVRTESRGRRFDLTALEGQMLALLGSVFLVYPWEQQETAMNPREAIEVVLQKGWTSREVEFWSALESLFLLAAAAAPGDDGAHRALVEVSNDLVREFAARIGETDPQLLADRARQLVYVRYGDAMLSRATREDPPSLDACRRAAKILVTQMAPPDDDRSPPPPKEEIHPDGGGRRQDAIMTRSTVVSAALLALNEAPFIDFLRFLTPSRVAARASVDRTTVAGYFSEPGSQGFSLQRLIEAVEHTLDVLIEQGDGLNGLAFEAKARLDLLGAACRRPAWRDAHQPRNADEQLAHLRALRRIPKEPVEDTLRLSAAHQAILVTGYMLAHRLARLEPQRQVIARLENWSAAAFSAPDGEPVSEAVFTDAIPPGVLKGSENAISIYDNIVAGFESDPQPPLRQAVAKALMGKALALGEMDRDAEAIGVIDEMVARFGDASEPELRRAVATALLSKGAMLGESAALVDAISVFDDIQARFSDATELALRQPLAGALVLKFLALRALERVQDANATLNEILARFGDDPGLDEIVELARARADGGGTPE